jgi:methionyl-tRNA formyltransferase
MPSNIKIRIIFMGTSIFADEILRSLLKENYNIISVWTKPDKKVGRDQEMKEAEVKLTAKQNKLPVFQPERLDENAIQEIKNQKPDLIVVAAYGKIIPESILEIPGFGALNVHPSLLPKFRGPSPIQNALLQGETETGTTIMLMNAGVDTGDILRQSKIKIDNEETKKELTEKLAKLSADLLLKTIPLWVERRIEPKKQDDSLATLCQLIERNDGRIVWTEDAESIYNRYRALTPWPGIFTFWKNDEKAKRIKMNSISLLKDNSPKFRLGEVFKFQEKIAVQTGKGAIILDEIQLEGKKSVKAEEFINGYQNFIGSVLN